jgi:hypothetical protein
MLCLIIPGRPKLPKIPMLGSVLFCGIRNFPFRGDDDAIEVRPMGEYDIRGFDL